MRLVDLDHADEVGAEIAHEAGGVAAGRLDRDAINPAVALKPPQRVGIAWRAGPEVGAAKQSAALIQGGDVVAVGVRVDAADDPRRLLRHAVHGCPSFRDRAAWSGRRTEQ